MAETGLAWWIVDGSPPCWLAVDRGRVVRGTPWLVRLLLGATSGVVEAAAVERRAIIWWTELSAPPTTWPTLSGKRLIRRWRHEGAGHLAEYHLMFGECDAGWLVHDTRMSLPLVLATAADGWAVCAGLCARGGWVRGPVGYGPYMKALDDPDLPGGLGELA